MNSDAIVTVAAAVVALTQLCKWAGLGEEKGPAAVIGFSLIGVALYVVGSESWPPARTDVWPIFAGCIAVATSAAGVFGFTRAAVGAVTRATPPPAGAAEQPVGLDLETLAAKLEDEQITLLREEAARLKRIHPLRQQQRQREGV